MSLHSVDDPKTARIGSQRIFGDFFGDFAENSSQSPPLLLSPAQTAHQLALSRYTVYELLRRGELRGVRYGRLVRVPRAEVERFASSLEPK